MHALLSLNDIYFVCRARALITQLAHHLSIVRQFLNYRSLCRLSGLPLFSNLRRRLAALERLLAKIFLINDAKLEQEVIRDILRCNLGVRDLLCHIFVFNRRWTARFTHLPFL